MCIPGKIGTKSSLNSILIGVMQQRGSKYTQLVVDVGKINMGIDIVGKCLIANLSGTVRLVYRMTQGGHTLGSP